MSRITGSDAFGLMEAYNAVYAPQELTEEQVWEEVEAWVNSLVEEGYDLSEYTWEDMYESYIEEQGGQRGARPVNRTSGAVTTYAQPRANTGQPFQSRFARPMNAGTGTLGTRRGAAPTTRPQIGSLPTNYRGAELQQTARARASQVGTTRQGTAGEPTTGGNTPIGSSPTRPAAPVATTTTRPTPQVSSRPAAPVSGVPKPTPTTTAAPTAPTVSTTAQRPPSPSSQISDIQRMRLASQMRQKGANVVSTQLASFDPFDVIKGHLLDEGYADTEEAALKIMANMSEEWKQSIIENIV